MRSGVLGEALGRATDAAQARGGGVGPALERIEHAALDVGRERVEREVAV
jgi:hypothetical protein